MKRIRLISVVLTAMLLVCVLVACSDGGDIPYGTPTSWKNYCDLLANAISEQALGEDGLNFTAQAKYVSEGKELLFALDFACDPKNVEDSAVAINVYSDDKSVFSIKADNKNSYIDITQNAVVASAKTKIEETNFFDWLNVEYNDGTEQETRQAIKNYVGDLCSTFFKNGDKSADGKYLTFTLADDVCGKTLTKFADILSFVDKNVANLFLGALGVDNASEIFERVGQVDGSIRFCVEGGKVTSVKGENFKVNQKASTLDVTFAKSDKEEIKATFPTSDAGYKITKMASSSVSGSLSNVDSGTKRTAVKFDFQLNTDIDVMKLVFNDYDLSCLGKDNSLHMRLSHKCDSHCTEYCASRIDNSKGAVIDVAFSPSDFGSSNLYINVNLKYLMSADYLRSVYKYDNTVTESNLPEYCMFTLVPGGMAKKICKLLVELYSDVATSDSDKIETSAKTVTDVFGDSEVAEIIFGQMSDDEFAVDTIRLKIDEKFGQAREYDIYEEVVYIIDSEVSEVKSYKSRIMPSLSKEYNALDWTYELKSDAQINGETVQLTNIYDSTGSFVLHGSKDGEYVPMSAIEAKDLVGCTIKYSYVNLDKNVVGDMLGIITAVGDYDAQSTDVQAVKLSVTHVGAYSYTWGVSGAMSDAVRGLFGCDFSQESQEVVAYIKFEKEESGSFKLTTADSNQTFKITSGSQKPQFICANVSIKYENGASKQYDVVGQSSAVVESYGNYYVVDWGTVTVRYNVAGRSIQKYATVKKPDAFSFSVNENYTSSIGNVCYITSRTFLRAIYIDGEKREEVEIALSLSDFYINGTSLDKESNDWGHHKNFGGEVLVFYKSNDYVVQVVKNEFRSDPFVLRVTDQSYTETKYELKTTSDLSTQGVVGQELTLLANIVNSVHGVGKNEHKVTITIYDVTELRKYADGYECTFEFDGSEVSSSSKSKGVEEYTVALPNLIKNGVPISLSLAFSKVGKYRVEIRIDLQGVYTQDIEIA